MGKRLYPLNLAKEYPLLKQHIATKTISGKKDLLQKDYGEDLDCTLTCLAFIFGADKYYGIERFAKKRAYDGKRWGTIPTTVKAIMRDCLKEFKMEGTCKSAYGKGIGWNFNKIRKLVDNGTYAVLNIWKDGRDYYFNHSVTVIGYVEYSNGQFITVYDNWNHGVSYVDYKKLSVISSINWYEKKAEGGD